MKVTKTQLKQIIKEELEQVQVNEERLDEVAILPLIMTALKNPEVQKMLMSMVMPMIQKAMAGAAAPAAE